MKDRPGFRSVEVPLRGGMPVILKRPVKRKTQCSLLAREHKRSSALGGASFVLSLHLFNDHSLASIQVSFAPAVGEHPTLGGGWPSERYEFSLLRRHCNDLKLTADLFSDRDDIGVHV